MQFEKMLKKVRTAALAAVIVVSACMIGDLTAQAEAAYTYLEGTYIAETDGENDWTQDTGSGFQQSIFGADGYIVNVRDVITLNQRSSVGSALTYTSSDKSVATVDVNGNVTAVGEGTATITVDAAAIDIYATTSKEVKITVYRKLQSITGVSSSYTRTYGDAAFSLGAKAQTTLSYDSDNEKVATVDKTGKVTITGVGTTNITITAEDTNVIEGLAKTVTLTVNKATQSITLRKTSYTKNYGNAAFSLGAKAQGTLSYASNNKKVVTVDANGKVTIKGVGTATITVKAVADANYKATANKTVKITVAKASQTIATKRSTASYKVSTLAKQAQTFTIGASAKTSVSYKVASGSKYISVSKAGVVTVKKGTKAGTYKITVTAVANTNYKAATKTITVTVK